MSAFQDEYQAVLKRIKSLERQNQVMRFLVLAVIVFIVGCTQPRTITAQGTSASPTSLDVLELRQLVFKDKNQNVRLKIDTTDSSNVYQSFYDEKGIERAQISIDSEGSARFRLFDTAGSARFAAVTFSDEHEKASNTARVAVLGFGNEGNSNKGGIILSTAADGSVENLMYQKDGKLQITSTLSPGGGAGYAMYDLFGTPRHSFNVFDGNGVANQLMLDDKGKTRFSNFTTASNSGQYNWDQNGVSKTSTVISEDNSLSHYVEKSASEQLLEVADGIFRFIDFARIVSGSN